MTDETKSSEQSLLDRLTELRDSTAAAEDKKAYSVFTDEILAEMADKKPSTLEEFSELKGVGPVKLERYGNKFLAIIASENGEDDETELEALIEEAQERIEEEKTENMREALTDRFKNLVTVKTADDAIGDEDEENEPVFDEDEEDKDEDFAAMLDDFEFDFPEADEDVDEAEEPEIDEDEIVSEDDDEEAAVPEAVDEEDASSEEFLLGVIKGQQTAVDACVDANTVSADALAKIVGLAVEEPEIDKEETMAEDEAEEVSVSEAVYEEDVNNEELLRGVIEDQRIAIDACTEANALTTDALTKIVDLTSEEQNKTEEASDVTEAETQDLAAELGAYNDDFDDAVAENTEEDDLEEAVADVLENDEPVAAVSEKKKKKHGTGAIVGMLFLGLIVGGAAGVAGGYFYEKPHTDAAVAESTELKGTLQETKDRLSQAEEEAAQYKEEAEGYLGNLDAIRTIINGVKFKDAVNETTNTASKNVNVNNEAKNEVSSAVNSVNAVIESSNTESAASNANVSYDKSGSLGLTLADSNGNGAVVQAVDANGAASTSGIKVGDIITKVNGSEVHSMAEANAAVHAHQPGDVIVLTLQNGSVKAVTLK